MNSWRTRNDNHDYMTPEHIGRFLRNHGTGVDNRGRAALANILHGYSDPTVLDAACGTCVNYEVFRNANVQCHYTGLDRTESMLRHARSLYGEDIDLMLGYVEELPFKDCSFDIVIMRHILEHLSERYELAIHEGLRVAKKELVLVFFLTPEMTSEDRIEESKPDENNCTFFWNTYSWPKLVEFLSQFGCKISTEYKVTPGAAHADFIVRLKK